VPQFRFPSSSHVLEDPTHCIRCGESHVAYRRIELREREFGLVYWGRGDEWIGVEDGEDFLDESSYDFVVSLDAEEFGVGTSVEGPKDLEDGLADHALYLEQVEVWEVGSQSTTQDGVGKEGVENEFQRAVFLLTEGTEAVI
jgi:hypothetical protein